MIGEVMKLQKLTIDDTSYGLDVYTNPRVCHVLSSSIRDFAVLTFVKMDSVFSKRSLKRMAEQIKENEILCKIDYLRQLFKKQTDLFFRVNQPLRDVSL